MSEALYFSETSADNSFRNSLFSCETRSISVIQKLRQFTRRLTRYINSPYFSVPIERIGFEIVELEKFYEFLQKWFISAQRYARFIIPSNKKTPVSIDNAAPEIFTPSQCGDRNTILTAIYATSTPQIAVKLPRSYLNTNAEMSLAVSIFNSLMRRFQKSLKSYNLIRIFFGENKLDNFTSLPLRTDITVGHKKSDPVRRFRSQRCKGGIIPRASLNKAASRSTINPTSHQDCSRSRPTDIKSPSQDRRRFPREITLCNHRLIYLAQSPSFTLKPFSFSEKEINCRPMKSQHVTYHSWGFSRFKQLKNSIFNFLRERITKHVEEYSTFHAITRGERMV